jgi:NAD(P)-dependent dehydrogenase (short-subunit alcohol dehydrogenase family)
VLALPADLSSLAEIDRIVRSSLESFGHVDMLVSNAGTTAREPFLGITAEDFDRVIAVNPREAYSLSQKIVRARIEKGIAAKIIFVASSTCFIGIPNLSA